MLTKTAHPALLNIPRRLVSMEYFKWIDVIIAVLKVIKEEVDD